MLSGKRTQLSAVLVTLPGLRGEFLLLKKEEKKKHEAHLTSLSKENKQTKKTHTVLNVPFETHCAFFFEICYVISPVSL